MLSPSRGSYVDGESSSCHEEEHEVSMSEKLPNQRTIITPKSAAVPDSRSTISAKAHKSSNN